MHRNVHAFRVLNMYGAACWDTSNNEINRCNRSYCWAESIDAKLLIERVTHQQFRMIHPPVSQKKPVISRPLCQLQDKHDHVNIGTVKKENEINLNRWLHLKTSSVS